MVADVIFEPRPSAGRAAVLDATLIHGDVTTVSFPAQAFDAVVALYVLTHILLGSQRLAGADQRLGLKPSRRISCDVRHRPHPRGLR